MIETPLLHQLESAPFINLMKSYKDCEYKIDDNGWILYEKENAILLVFQKDAAKLSSWLKEFKNYPVEKAMVYYRSQADLVAKEFNLVVKDQAYLYVYPSTKKLEISNRLHFKEAALTDLDLIAAHYQLLEKEELKKYISNNQIFIAFDQEEIVGFGGFHSEMSMGLLEVFPKYRNQGFGQDIETFLINMAISRGLIPYSDILIHNDVSVRLQKKLGLKDSGYDTYWLF